MKHKMLFIMPRLVGATMVLGAATLIIATLFKLLLGLTIIGGVITLVASKAGWRRNRLMAQYGQDELPGLGRRNTLGSFWGSQVTSISQTMQKGTTIVPIN